jgi:hypothetical protein
MNIWTCMNGAAWALSAALFIRIAWDFFKVERERRARKDDEDASEDGNP